MRTTVDLDERTYKFAKAIAGQRKISLGKVIAEAISDRYGLSKDLARPKFGVSAAGFPTIESDGPPVTSEFVKEMIDE